MFVIKFLIYFSLSFFILNIPISGNPLFYSLEEVARPVTDKLFTFMKKNSQESINKTKKLFTNTVPTKKDEVKVKRSSTIKPMGKYTSEERDFLENILKKAQ